MSSESKINNLPVLNTRCGSTPAASTNISYQRSGNNKRDFEGGRGLAAKTRSLPIFVFKIADSSEFAAVMSDQNRIGG